MTRRRVRSHTRLIFAEDDQSPALALCESMSYFQSGRIILLLCLPPFDWAVLLMPMEDKAASYCGLYPKLLSSFCELRQSLSTLTKISRKILLPKNFSRLLRASVETFLRAMP